jgi:hypothetical protein
MERSERDDRPAASRPQEAGHVALLGDSILDNGAYTRGQPDVVSHLRTLLPASWQATLCARDGATTTSLRAQFTSVPADTSHIVVAIGGNDALANRDLLSMSVTSTEEALRIFARRVAEFDRSYRRVIADVMALGKATTVCTIYNGALEEPVATIARVALTLFNDSILRTAAGLGADVIELRLICIEAADYANPIEPSGKGGMKIARAIAGALGVLPPARAPVRLFS